MAWVPAESVTSVLGGEGLMPILAATPVGIPACLNRYAALPLVARLIDQGMAPLAGLAFLVARGGPSIPTAMAVCALAKPRVVALHIRLPLAGAFASGLLVQVWAGTWGQVRGGSRATPGDRQPGCAAS